MIAQCRHDVPVAPQASHERLHSTLPYTVGRDLHICTALVVDDTIGWTAGINARLERLPRLCPPRSPPCDHPVACILVCAKRIRGRSRYLCNAQNSNFAAGCVAASYRQRCTDETTLVVPGSRKQVMAIIGSPLLRFMPTSSHGSTFVTT
jgi:hypothetical protein